MTKSSRHHRFFSLSTVLVLSLCAAVASGAPTIDGRFDPGEGYTNTYSVVFSKSPDQGSFYVYQDPVSKDLSVALVAPKAYVDNSYGANSIGWKKGHGFKDLVGSDVGVFNILDTSGKELISFKMDYIHAYGGKSGASYRSGDAFDGEGAIATSLAPFYKQGETSLGYNYAQFGAANPQYFGDGSSSPAANPDYSNSALPGWVYEVTYEFQLAGSLFAGKSFDPSDKASFVLESVHASPPKSDYGDPTVVPEPTSFIAWSILGGLGLMGLVRNRRKKG